MTYTRAELNAAVSEKLVDIDEAVGMHKGLFIITQLSGVLGIAGGVLIMPLAVEVGAIAAGAGAVLWGVSQIIQSSRLKRFLPLPGVAISIGEIGYWPSAIAAQLMGSEVPEAPNNEKLLPAEWLPPKERRIAYLLTHCPDILISAAENAQEGVSFAAIVDMAVRASEYAITDDQLTNPVTSRQLAGEVRQLLTGDTSALEARQQQASLAELDHARRDHAAGLIDDADLEAIEAEVTAIAPGAALLSADTASSAVSIQAEQASAYDAITASPYRSRFFLGGQRTGKSFLAVSCAIAAKERGANIYYLNLSAWGNEDDGYSAIAHKSITANIQALQGHYAENTIADAHKLLQAFFVDDSPAILILEEWCELGSKNHQHKELLEGLLAYSASIVEQLANTGQKRRKAIYATGPMFVAGSLQQATKAAKSMALVLVAVPPGRTLYWNEQALTFDPAVYAMAANNWHGVSEPAGSFDCDRIALVDGQWREVGGLPAMPAAKPSGKAEPLTVEAVAVDAVAKSKEPEWISFCEELKADGRDSAADLIRWANTTSKECFTLRDVTTGRTMRKYGADECRRAIAAMVESGWLLDNRDETYSVIPD